MSEFIILHMRDRPFYYRADAVISIEEPLPQDGQPWANAVINYGGAFRYVTETPERVKALVDGATRAKRFMRE